MFCTWASWLWGAECLLMEPVMKMTLCHHCHWFLLNSNWSMGSNGLLKLPWSLRHFFSPETCTWKSQGRGNFLAPSQPRWKGWGGPCSEMSRVSEDTLSVRLSQSQLWFHSQWSVAFKMVNSLRVIRSRSWCIPVWMLTVHEEHSSTLSKLNCLLSQDVPVCRLEPCKTQVLALLKGKSWGMDSRADRVSHTCS